MLFLSGFPSDRVATAYLSPDVDSSTELFSWAVPNFVEISDFAQDRLGWPRQKVDEIIKPVIKKLNNKAVQVMISFLESVVIFFNAEQVTINK